MKEGVREGECERKREEVELGREGRRGGSGGEREGVREGGSERGRE